MTGCLGLGHDCSLGGVFCGCFGCNFHVFFAFCNSYLVSEVGLAIVQPSVMEFLLDKRLCRFETLFRGLVLLVVRVCLSTIEVFVKELMLCSISCVLCWFSIVGFQATFKPLDRFHLIISMGSVQSEIMSISVLGLSKSALVIVITSF